MCLSRFLHLDRRIMSRNGQTHGWGVFPSSKKTKQKKSLQNSNKFSTFLQTLYNFQRRRWPTFLHGLTCSTVAVRRRSILGGGRTLLSPMRHGGRGRARERGWKTRSSYSDFFPQPETAERRTSALWCMFDGPDWFFSKFSHLVKLYITIILILVISSH